MGAAFVAAESTLSTTLDHQSEHGIGDVRGHPQDMLRVIQFVTGQGQHATD